MATAFIEIVIGELAKAVVGKLGEMAVEQVANQASLLLHFRKDFEWLKDEFTKVGGYLQYADGLSIKSELVKKWLADLQGIAFDAEDIVEECLVQHHESFIFRYMMGRRIKKIKDRMKLIIKDAKELKLVQELLHDGRAAQEDQNKSAVQEWKKSGLLERDARPVAIDVKVEQILHFLEDDALQVIAVVGMGGMGKTFLLQNVYNHPKVQQRFEKTIWLSISQVYSVARLQNDIASHLGVDVKKPKVSEQDVAELVKKGVLSEQQAAKLFKKLEITEQLVTELVKEGVLSEQQATELLKEGGASEQRVTELVEEGVLSKQQVQELFKKAEVSEQRVTELVKRGVLSKQQAAKLVKEGGPSEQRVTELVEEGVLSKQQAAELFKKAEVSEQRVTELVKEGVLSKDQAKRLLDERSLTELIKEGGVSVQRAAELIQERLREKSCFIVLDDVWRVESNDNLMQRLGIPSGTNNPCKVVVTTRSMEVCKGACKEETLQIYRMELLSEQDSWNLFCLHAFPDDQQNRSSQELYEVAHQVERECGRLPLAIKTVAASMASEKLLRAWELKLRQLKEVSDPEDLTMAILRLSYNVLPSVLKPCFLYFSFFGEDEEIDAEYLIYLWMAEGFIPKGKEQWSRGWSYLKQLNNLCLVEVSEDEELKITCKIHDLLLDLIISICRENKCAFTVEEASAVGSRRILLAKKGLDENGIKQLKCPKSLRTLSLSQNSIKKLPPKSLSSVLALRVIDISYTNIFLLPRCMGNFKLLRVLNLGNDSTHLFENVPNCVRNLRSLRFLNAPNFTVPEWIGDLKCLQHLHLRRVDYSLEVSRGISNLVSLGTLRISDNMFGCKLVLKDVAKLIHLEELRIDIANEEEQRSLEEGVLPVNMRRLTIACHKRGSDFPEKMKAMRDLQYLKLRLFRVPRWICEYENLMVLQLISCELSEWTAVETMPNLIKLELYLCRGCKEFPESFGKSGAFPHLRYFRIQDCFELEKLPQLHDGAMPRVEVIRVLKCQSLQKIPEGFEQLRSLKLLDLSYWNCFSDEEMERLKEGGEYWNKIKANNPHVTIKMDSDSDSE